MVAGTGRIGDGKISVILIDEVVRIRTGQGGGEAI
jgi:nitrogen regulatory protein PII